jgi:peptidoglycan/xylan/chitin deacetylase (PgdA/CDA1 family)
LREYDFLGGVGRHKTDWGAIAKQSKQTVLAEANYRNFLFADGLRWKERIRESIKQVVPARILAARRRRIDRTVASISVPAKELVQNGGQSTPFRNAAAHIYFNSKLPVLARHLRQRYEMSGTPRFAWRRRTEAMGRILYYHRVNSENDPFFPATSIDLFDQAMRFVSSHYKVVGLGEMLERMKGGPPEHLVAITFDDGYKDNYQNAFPILERYGLPATIFLTTGSVDSREPLWFEQMAEAIKKSPREFIDLEIDLPRRFWLRSESERLDTNRRIYGILRELKELDRREQMARILKQLGCPPLNERNDKMLTWDQIREMRARRIDFGGHTVSHPFLSRLTPEQVKWEVSECKRRIEEELQLSVDHFAYPSGREEDLGSGNKEIIRAAGYFAAVTTRWGVNYGSTDRLELRRGGPWESNAALFAWKLDWYQLLNA